MIELKGVGFRIDGNWLVRDIISQLKRGCYGVSSVPTARVNRHSYA